MRYWRRMFLWGLWYVYVFDRLTQIFPHFVRYKPSFTFKVILYNSRPLQYQLRLRRRRIMYFWDLWYVYFYLRFLQLFAYYKIEFFSYVINNIIIPIFCYKCQDVAFWEKEVKARIKEVAPMKKNVNTLESVKVTTASYILRQ